MKPDERRHRLKTSLSHQKSTETASSIISPGYPACHSYFGDYPSPPPPYEVCKCIFSSGLKPVISLYLPVDSSLNG